MTILQGWGGGPQVAHHICMYIYMLYIIFIYGARPAGPPLPPRRMVMVPPPPPVGLGVSPVGHCCALAFHISNQHKQLLLVCTLTYDQTLTKNMQHTDI